MLKVSRLRAIRSSWTRLQIKGIHHETYILDSTWKKNIYHETYIPKEIGILIRIKTIDVKSMKHKYECYIIEQYMLHEKYETRVNIVKR